MRAPVGSSERLTQKQRNFAQEYLRCGNATEAYLFAYDTTNRDIAQRESKLLLKVPHIVQYMEEINKPIAEKIISDREKKRAILWEGIQRCIDKEDESGAARYMDILNKMDMEYINVNRNIVDPAESIAKLDTNQLLQLLEQPSEQAEQSEQK